MSNAATWGRVNSPQQPEELKSAPQTLMNSKTAGEQNLYKTELCRSYEETGTCRYGPKCQFAHGQDELRHITRHPKYKTEVCKTFSTTGTCPYGKRCRFIHSDGKKEQTAQPLSNSTQYATTWAPFHSTFGVGGAPATNYSPTLPQRNEFSSTFAPLAQNDSPFELVTPSFGSPYSAPTTPKRLSFFESIAK